jgi:hypothetical protein
VGRGRLKTQVYAMLERRNPSDRAVSAWLYRGTGKAKPEKPSAFAFSHGFGRLQSDARRAALKLTRARDDGRGSGQLQSFMLSLRRTLVRLFRADFGLSWA